uniref:Uncharacterized protein n=1 Tax=Seriola lalandi dorsalis TaxID=1841481 RepID=A0A3B4XAT0_SERLL
MFTDIQTCSYRCSNMFTQMFKHVHTDVHTDVHRRSNMFIQMSVCFLSDTVTPQKRVCRVFLLILIKARDLIRLPCSFRTTWIFLRGFERTVKSIWCRSWMLGSLTGE